MKKEIIRQRPRFFHERVIRLLARQCVAHEIGADACWWISVIVTQAMIVGFTRAVTYWNEQLMPICGFGSKSRLSNVRRKAVESGWLNYVPGTKHTAGKYEVMIPAALNNDWDGPVDEATTSQNPSDSIAWSPNLEDRKLNTENTSNRTPSTPGAVQRQSPILNEQEQELPPPPWNEVEVALRGNGLATAADAVALAQRQHLSTCTVLELIKEYKSRKAKREVTSPGLLVTRIRNFREGDNPSKGWPDPKPKNRSRPCRDKVEAAARKLRDGVFAKDQDASNDEILNNVAAQIRSGPPTGWHEVWTERSRQSQSNIFKNDDTRFIPSNSPNQTEPTRRL